uniref:hypothetical protein n=1 Tax=Synechococcus sp. CS-1329 TaxID=2847975 RepID=UPI00223B0417|nr:hypothetical protein [Synechococcus sp. CS-1329]
MLQERLSCRQSSRAAAFCCAVNRPPAITLIQLECSLLPFNSGAPLIGEVIDQLRD